MKLLKLSFMIAMVAFLGSCQLAKFDRVPGEALGNIPVEFHGKYVMATKDLKGFWGSDSIGLEIENSTIHVKSKGINFSKTHDQDYKMATFRGYILLAMTDATIPALWNLAVLEKTKSGLRIYPLLDKRASAEDPGKLAQFTPQQMLNITSEPIPPSVAPMTEAGTAPVNSPNQGLPPRVYFFTMMEDQFADYLKTEIIGKEFLQFEKVEIKAKKK